MSPKLFITLRRNFILMVFFAFVPELFTQTYDLMPISTTIANASVAQSDQYQAFTNPASAAIDYYTIGATYQNNFLLNELSKRSVYASVPTNLVNIAASFSYSGYALYNEILVGCAIARQFGDVFSLGVQYNYLSVYMAESNKRYSVFFPQIGTQIKLSDNFMLGMSVFNPAQQSIKKSLTPITLPAIYSMGFKWDLSDDFSILSQVDKNLTGGYRIAAGFEYDIKNTFLFKCGAFHADYLVPTLGFGLKLNKLNFHLNTHFHPVLGLQTVSSLSFIVGKSK